MPRASDKRVAVYIYPENDLAAWIRRLAKRERRSMNQQVLALLEEARKGAVNGRTGE